jgi:maltooligosyltrehalose trehalohydrolase
MHEFVTKARDAKEVAITIYGADGKTVEGMYPMQRDEFNKWRVRVPGTGPGTLYKVNINGTDFPDAFSYSQPQGVHGPSEVVDTAFDWAPFRPASLANEIIYEAHIGTYTPEGTFGSALEKVDHLKSLGVTRLQLMPLAEASGNHGWGYDGTFLSAINHNYGGIKQFQEFVNECHKAGIAVHVDVVYNHLGAEGNYYNNHIKLNSDKETPWGRAINFDEEGSDDVARMVLENANFLLRTCNIDGLRLDSMDDIKSSNLIHVVQSLTTLAKRISKETGSERIITGETHKNDPTYLDPIGKGGMGVDAVHVTDFRYALSALSPTAKYRDPNEKDFGTLERLATALTNGIVLDGSIYSEHHQGYHGHPFPNATAQQMIVHYENHDDIGNTAEGRRPEDYEQEQIALALMLTGHHIPFIFQGQEWGSTGRFMYFTDHSDPVVAAATIKGRTGEIVAQRGCPAEIVPNCQDRATFEGSKLDWSELELAKSQNMVQWFRALAGLRQEFKLGHSQSVEVQFDEKHRTLALKNGAVTTVVNFSGETQTISLPTGDSAVMLSSKPDYSLDGQQDRLTLGPKSVVILQNAASDPKLVDSPDTGSAVPASEVRRLLDRTFEGAPALVGHRAA